MRSGLARDSGGSEMRLALELWVEDELETGALNGRDADAIRSVREIVVESASSVKITPGVMTAEKIDQALRVIREKTSIWDAKDKICSLQEMLDESVAESCLRISSERAKDLYDLVYNHKIDERVGRGVALERVREELGSGKTTEELRYWMNEEIDRIERGLSEDLLWANKMLIKGRVETLIEARAMLAD